ncbi:hypothetical protein F2P79_013856, partial [Pimephales promelas]
SLGYIMISVFSVSAIVIVGIHDCCTSGKCCRKCHTPIPTEPSSPEIPSTGDRGQQDIQLPDRTST